MNFTQSSKPLILVHKAMEVSQQSSVVNIILSPQFYITKQEALPVKYSYQAKKLAPSILEELLDEDKNYRFHVFKRANSWIFIAYDLESIKDFLLSKGIYESNVSQMFFAQGYADKFTKPVLLESGELLTTMHDTVVLLPKMLVDTSRYYAPFDSQMKLKEGISFSLNSGSLLGQKESLILTLLFSLF